MGRNPNTRSRLTEIYNDRSSRWNLYRCECGVEKLLRKNSVRAGNTKSCGCIAHETRKRGHRQPIVQRLVKFFSLISGPTPTGCREWMGNRFGSNYGEFTWKGKRTLTHRLSLILSGVHVPDDMLVLHSCDNGICVNPEHLRVGTYADNMRDASTRGRLRPQFGVKNKNSKLTEEQVIEIKRLLGTMTARRIGEIFGVTQGAILPIKHGRTWKHIV